MIFTFFSFKGGVGRSMAVANLAALWRRAGHRVLVVDWDLEAPGLESFFHEGRTEEIARVRKHPGVLDLLEAYEAFSTSHGPIREQDFDGAGGRAAALPNVDRYLIDLIPADEAGPTLWFLPSGRRDHGLDRYARRVRSFGWRELIEDYEGALFYEWLRQRLLDRADLVLIDARTGISEMGGVCTHFLADLVVLLTGPNPQSIEGTAEVAQALRKVGAQELRADRPLEMLVVPSRIDIARETDYHGTLQRLLGPLFPGVDFATEDRQRLEIPYIAKYAAREALAVGERDRVDSAFRAIAQHIEDESIGRFEVVLQASDGDAETRRELASFLTDHGVACWWDHQTHRALGFRLGRMRSRLHRSRALVAIWSAHANADPAFRAAIEEFHRPGLETRSGPRGVYLYRPSDEAVPGWLQAAASEELTAPEALLDSLGTGAPHLGLVSYFRNLSTRCEHVELPLLEPPAEALESDLPSYLPLRELFVERRFRVLGPTGDEGDAADRRLGWVLSRPQVQLVGEPGAGKTTLLRYVAFRLAQLQLNRDDGALTRFGLSHRPFPVYVHLPELQAHLEAFERSARRPVQDWLEALRAHLVGAGAELDVNELDRMLRRGGVVVLADALDEVEDPEDQRRLAEELSQFADLRPGDPQGNRPNRVLLATRPGSARPLHGFTTVAVEPFGLGDVRAFLERWAEAHGERRMDRDHVQDLEKLLLDPEIRELESNPLLLTILVSLFSRQGLRLENVAELYRHILDRLIDRRRTQLEPWGKPAEVQGYLISLAERTWQTEGGLSSEPPPEPAEGGPSESNGGEETHSRPRERPWLEVSEAVEALQEASWAITGKQRLDGDEAGALLDALERHVGVYEVGREGDLAGPRQNGVPRQDGRPGGGERRLWFRYPTLFEHLVASGAAGRELPASFLLDQRRHPSWHRLADLTAGVLGLDPSGKGRLRGFLQALADFAKKPAAESEKVICATALLARLHATATEDLAGLTGEMLGQVLALLERADPAVPREQRVDVANGLARYTRDPRLRDERRWCEVSSGTFYRGSDDLAARADESPMQRVGLPYDFRIGRWLVTAEEFWRFVEDGGYERKGCWSRGGLAWLSSQSKENLVALREELDLQRRERGNHPVVGVTWWEAEAFSAWLSAALAAAGSLPEGSAVRLPSEDEWEMAARGGTVVAGRENPIPVRLFPWGDEFDPDRLNSRVGASARDEAPTARSEEKAPVGTAGPESEKGRRSTGTTPVGCFPGGHGPYGAWDQAGNVHEWCLDVYRAERGRPPASARGPEVPAGDEPRSLRGGSWQNNNERRLRVTARASEAPGNRIGDKETGFRCVLGPTAVAPSPQPEPPVSAPPRRDTG